MNGHPWFTFLRPDYIAQRHGNYPRPLSPAQPYGLGPLEGAWAGQGTQPLPPVAMNPEAPGGLPVGATQVGNVNGPPGPEAHPPGWGDTQLGHPSPGGGPAGRNGDPRWGPGGDTRQGG